MQVFPDIIVTGIGTDAGKTVAAGVLTAGLGADYWKPLQTGVTDGALSDSEWIRLNALAEKAVAHPEIYRLPAPEAPFIAAARAGVKIDVERLQRPQTANRLVIEGAGGVLVPITAEYNMVDLFLALGAPVVLVARLYLGAINHTLLSIEALRARKVPFIGIIFVESKEYDGADARKFILNQSAAPDLGTLSILPQFNFETLRRVFETQLNAWF